LGAAACCGNRLSPAAATGYHSLTARGHSPAASSARPALSPGALSTPPPWSPCTERPGWRSRWQPISGLGAAAPATGAPARYGEPAGQHEGGEGSPGRWRDDGVAESSSVNGVRWRWSWHGGHRRSGLAPAAWRRRAMSRGWLVATDRSSGRHSTTKAGGDVVQAETGVVHCGPTPLGHRGWMGRRGERSGGGGTAKRGTASGDAFLRQLDGAAGRKRAGGPAWCRVVAGGGAEREGPGCGAS
jgi:hypothetical protein